MGTFKDVYDILKDLIKEAKKLKSQEMISLSLDVQEKLFELKEEIESIKDENKELKDELQQYKNPQIEEKDICYSPNGFFTLKSEGNKLPYCSACWKTKKLLVPLAKHSNAWRFVCSECKSQIVVEGPNGEEF